MGFINSLMHRNMKKEAGRRATWAADYYKKIRDQFPDVTEREVFGKMLDSRFKFPDGAKAREVVLDRYGSSLNGLCYYIGLNSPTMKGTMVLRCLQFVEYVDIELQKRGFDKPSDDVKRGYFKTLDLPETAVNETRL